jgi:crotonobetainyl-CoA:carnitine CoA-transferase CaiB-like acyl-CoA transferase
MPEPASTGQAPHEDRQVLSGIRVLDLSRWVSGEFAAKLFADFGADVIKVEKPGEGSYTRHWGPFPGDKPDPEASALYLHLNTNWDEFITYLRAWFAARPKIELMTRCEAARIPLTAYLEMDELAANEHFRGRGCFVAAGHPVAGELEYVGPPWRMRGGYRLRHAAPLLDQHGAEIRAEAGSASTRSAASSAFDS